MLSTCQTSKPRQDVLRIYQRHPDNASRTYIPLVHVESYVLQAGECTYMYNPSLMAWLQAIGPSSGRGSVELQAGQAGHQATTGQGGTVLLCRASRYQYVWSRSGP
jgi:hypothetical protein